MDSGDGIGDQSMVTSHRKRWATVFAVLWAVTSVVMIIHSAGWFASWWPFDHWTWGLASVLLVALLVLETGFYVHGRVVNG